MTLTTAARCGECGGYLGDEGLCVTLGCAGGDGQTPKTTPRVPPYAVRKRLREATLAAGRNRSPFRLAVRVPGRAVEDVANDNTLDAVYEQLGRVQADLCRDYWCGEFVQDGADAVALFAIEPYDGVDARTLGAALESVMGTLRAQSGLQVDWA